MKEYIAKAVDGKNLTQEEAKKAMEIMLSGEATFCDVNSPLKIICGGCGENAGAL